MKTTNKEMQGDTLNTTGVQSQTQRPVYWKQVLVTTFTVYPLLMGITWLMKSVFPMQGVKIEIATFFAVVAVASLMVFPVMPLTMKLLGPWLHKR